MQKGTTLDCSFGSGDKKNKGRNLRYVPGYLSYKIDPLDLNLFGSHWIHQARNITNPWKHRDHDGHHGDQIRSTSSTAERHPARPLPTPHQQFTKTSRARRCRTQVLLDTEAEPSVEKTELAERKEKVILRLNRPRRPPRHQHQHR